MKKPARLIPECCTAKSYADEVAKLTQDAVAARLAGVKAAASALGHTNTATTQNSYLST